MPTQAVSKSALKPITDICTRLGCTILDETIRDETNSSHEGDCLYQCPRHSASALDCGRVSASCHFISHFRMASIWLVHVTPHLVPAVLNEKMYDDEFCNLPVSFYNFVFLLLCYNCSVLAWTATFRYCRIQACTNTSLARGLVVVPQLLPPDFCSMDHLMLLH